MARSPSSRSTKIKKIMYDAAENDDFDREEVATYEEVGTEEPEETWPTVVSEPSVYES